MSQRAVNLSLRRAPFVVQQAWVARAVLGFGTHALLCTAGGVMAFVFQEFIREYALELALWELFVALEAVAEGTSQRVTLHLPELSHLYLGGVKLQCSPH